ncbi:MAG TPA: oligosaccharide flippase family protein [Solirubrobacterales bacterium]|jgi:O-antigen/teichoic acid export membrane protein|nr:oligosaccharide flippase family protein [Solirubrobacterales bacterium]
MSGYLRRLATTGAAYTAANILSKLIAVGLLPLYTRYLTPADYGAAEILFAAVVSASIVIRLGVIEAVLRFYYKPGEDPEAVVATSFAALFWFATIASLVALPFAGPISEALLDKPAPDLTRIAIGGLWIATMHEYLLTLFRLEERAKAFFVVTIVNVLAAIALTVVLVVGRDEGARGLLLGSYVSGAVVVLALIYIHRRRLSLWFDRVLLRRIMRFGLPTMPAELSLYALNFVDRIIIVRTVGLTEAGLYSLAVKFAQGVNVLVRGFQLAWPPLAYSIRDDEEARRAYAAVVTWFMAACAFVVIGMWLFSRWIVRALAAPEFFDSYEAIGLLTTAVTLYALYMVLLVILGRTGRTEFNFPATAAALAVNVVLNLILVPSLEIVGAGIALVVSYHVVIALMYRFTQRLFPVPYEWARLARLLAVSIALVLIGEVLLPTSGAAGLAGRIVVWLAYPVTLLAAGFFSDEERRWLRRLRHPAGLVAEFTAASREAPAVDGAIPEAYEVARIDEDSTA